jgi:ABC-2 type transport system ATP-binding protein
VIGESRIEIEGLSKSYRGSTVPVLNNLDLAVTAGEIFGLIGPNGAGKTTLMSCLLGLLRPERGTIRLGGRTPDDLEVRAVTGYLPERLQFDRSMSGRRFVAFHHALAGQPAASRPREVEALLERAGLDPRQWDAPLRRYSRGMLQRLGLAQALIGSPRFLFLDEPASGVDPAGVLAFRRVLGELRRDGVTVVLNSHQLDQIERICDRVAFIEGGRIRTIEDLHRSSDQARVMRVRWVSNPQGLEAVRRAVATAEATLLDGEAGSARFALRGDEQAAALIRALVAEGVAVSEATPEAGRLERMFTEAPAEAP